MTDKTYTGDDIKDILGKLEPVIRETHTKVCTNETELKHTLKTIPAVGIMFGIFAMGYVIPQILEAPSQRADSELMFCVNGADDDFPHIPYADVKEIARRVCRVISQGNEEALKH